MSKIHASGATLRVFFTSITLAVVLIAGFSVGPWATRAAADSNTEMINCPQYNGHQVGYAPYGEGYYGWTSQYTVPTSSQCEDINLGNFWGYDYYGNLISSCADFRIRFYPSSGGSYTNSWKYVCSWTNGSTTPTNWLIATDVLNGTKYRVEFKYVTLTTHDSYRFTIWH